MKRFILILAVLFADFIPMNAQNNWGYGAESATQEKEQASITFKNNSDFSMVVKVIKSYGGLYTTLYLGAQRSEIITFDHTSSYKLKIKATHNGHTSYHKGGNFSVKCTDTEWTVGTMEFRMSTYGSGLGPTISAKDFEDNN